MRTAALGRNQPITTGRNRPKAVIQTYRSETLKRNIAFSSPPSVVLQLKTVTLGSVNYRLARLFQVQGPGTREAQVQRRQHEQSQ